MVSYRLLMAENNDFVDLMLEHDDADKRKNIPIVSKTNVLFFNNLLINSTIIT